MPKLFVIMPFGTREMPAGDGPLDFDAVYRELIRPAATDAGWDSLRIDELTVPGPISNQYLRELYGSDLVLADVSVPNGNVFYELGIRQAISPAGTLLIALDGTMLPFDLRDQRVLFYRRDDVSLRRQLADALASYDPASTTNPVRTFLEALSLSSSPTRDEAAFERELNDRIERAGNADQLVAVWQWSKAFRPLPPSAMLRLAKNLANNRDYVTAVDVLQATKLTAERDYEVHRQLGFYLRNIGPEHNEEAMKEFSRALELNPGDPETLGMIGGLLKRQGRYEEAQKYYERGAILSPTNLYMQVNGPAMAVLSSPTDPKRGVELYRVLLSRLSADPVFANDSWAALVRSEASLAIGDDDSALAHGLSAIKFGARSLDLRSVAEQLELLGESGFRPKDAKRLAKWMFQKAHELELDSKGTPAPAPATMPAQKVRPRSLVFHLSDLHFGSKSEGGREVIMHRFYDSENTDRLSTHLIRELSGHMKRRGIGPDGAMIAVSGDLTYTGTEKEFKQVEEFLSELCHGTEIERSHVLLVPGNHDVNWALAIIDKDKRFDNYLWFLRKFYGEATFRSLYPLIEWDFEIGSPRPLPSQMIALHASETLVAVGLNSCVFETEQHHYGFVGRRQLDNVKKLMADLTTGDSSVKMAVLHHHLHPFPELIEAREAKEEIYIDVSTIRDAGLVERQLEAMRFDLVLHGHKHKPQVRETLVRDRYVESGHEARPLIVCGAGSTGVCEKELEHSQANHYGIVEILRQPREPGADFVRVDWSELTLDPLAEWSAPKGWPLKG